MIKRKVGLKRSTKPIQRSTKPIARNVRPRKHRKLHGVRAALPSDEYLLGLLSQAVRLRDPICVKCRKAPTYDAMHMIGRSARRVRWDLDNVMGGCRKCHDYFTRHGKLWAEWWKRRIGTEASEALQRKASNMNVKPDPEGARVRLLAFIKEMKNVRTAAVSTADDRRNPLHYRVRPEHGSRERDSVPDPDESNHHEGSLA